MQKRKLKIFISMPFSGKQFEALYQERLDLKVLVESYGFELTEQFIGYQFKEDFESKDYDPKWVVGKDKNWLKQSDVVISDFGSYSMGTDFELILSKEVFNKPVYAVVPEEKRFHPWLKFYCGCYFDSIVDALEQIRADYGDGPKEVEKVDKRQYDPIAGEYRLVEETPAQKYIYDENLKHQFESTGVKGKKVVVLHCGSGYRARLAKNAGAAEVLGIDLAHHNIRLAEDIEDQQPQGIQYVATDVFLNDVEGNVPKDFIGGTDVVVGYFAFDHAMNKSELNMLALNVKKLLKTDGVFVGMSDCPLGNSALSPKYGVGLSFDEKNESHEEGKPRKISIYKDSMEVTHFHNFVWKKETLHSVLETAGFASIEIQPAKVSDLARAACGGEFWNEYAAAPDQVTIKANI
jgi:2-polyprenyl-3-methyl-5-hydroxy-6-metoxy-1,4-benzoquinol methylase